MTIRPRKDRKDSKKNARVPMLSEATKKYTTSSILSQLRKERDFYAMVSIEYLAMADEWIEKFSHYPEVEFYMDFENKYDFLVDLLERRKEFLECVVYAKNRRRRSLLPQDCFRSKRISVYLSDNEIMKLENLAKSENMSISSLLRHLGLNKKITPKPAKLDLRAYRELAHASSNLNQIARHLNSHPEAIQDLDSIQAVLNDFRSSLIGAGVTESGNEG